MRLPINDEYRLGSDAHSWSIQRRKQRKRYGETVTEWSAIAWYGTFEAAVAGLGERMLRESEAEGLVEALAETKRVCATLSRALPTHIRVHCESEVD